MCNLSEGINEQRMECGIDRGIERGIKAFVELCNEMQISKEETSKKVELKFSLPDQTAMEHVVRYYK